MADFIRGQRWISDTESELGLGLILEVDVRRVTVLFPAVDETRLYAKDQAPLTRVRFQLGDTISSHQGESLEITDIEERQGVLTYIGKTAEGNSKRLPELQLAHHIQFSKPQDRLFAGQIDAPKWFDLRLETLQKRSRLAQSPVRGLLGARLSLIPHQLYIAQEVASRYAPRVLLADEVGLGKTIEAGLILHQQLFTERARRVLLLVPGTLVHQWLVEMLRRFNLRFSIFDEERCVEAEADTGSNPFLTEQLALCSLSFFLKRPNRHAQAVESTWDLLVVDEAHHLTWTATQVSPQYHLVEQLAQRTRGLLLLTATPEQLGQAGHFARLRLLDRHRFYDYQAFLQEDAHYEPVANAVQQLLSDEHLSATNLQPLLDKLGEGEQAWLQVLHDTSADAAEREQSRQRLLNLLLDRHGTGRVLFRNSRATIAGFPPRKVHFYPLPLPPIYQDLARALYPEVSIQSVRPTPLSETYDAPSTPSNPSWWTLDPRVGWLMTTLAALKPEKVLIICAHAQTALDLDECLFAQGGIRSTVFHEGLSIVQRDRAAAYFADTENGARVLVCSEIGSEGRNFQFAHHLVLFDLPLNPDLLEQRIGRLDRIGQTQTIQIHVPYLKDSAQETLCHWYQQGLNSFEHTSPAAAGVFAELGERLQHGLQDANADAKTLLQDTQALHQKLREHLQKGRDHLLEMNSCRPQIAARWVDAVEQQDDDATLQPFVEQLCDCFGIQLDEHSDNIWLMQPTEHLLATGLPTLDEDGMLVTFERDTALMREDVQFLTWEHPLVRGGMDWVLGNELGNTALITLKHPQLPAGTLLLESLFSVVCAAPAHLQPDRFAPALAVHLLLDQQATDWSRLLPIGNLQGAQAVDIQTARRLVKAAREPLETLVKLSEAQAAKHLPRLIQTSIALMENSLQPEIERLHALRQVNPNVREEEVIFVENQIASLRQQLQVAQLQLQGIRVLLAT